MKHHWPTVSLRSVLIGVNLVVLILPLAGIQLMRLYESALVRQTESALIAQGAFVAALYRSIVAEQGTQDWLAMSREIDLSDAQKEDRWVPYLPSLDLATSKVLPPFPDGISGITPRPLIKQIGQRMLPVLKDAQLVTLAGIRVVDPWGTIIASTGTDVGANIAQTEELRGALAGRAISRLRSKSELVKVSTLDSISRTSTVRVFVAQPIILHGRLIGAVVLSRTPPNIVQALYAKRWLLMQGFAMLLALVVFMSWVTFRMIARPISKLAAEAQAIAGGEISASDAQKRLQKHVPRTKEIANLHAAITDMAARLEERTAYLQDLSRHVSHEFKTPLASIRGAIEVLQDHSETMTSDQQQRFLTNVSADADRLGRLTQRLSERTHAEMNDRKRSRVLLRSTLADVCSRFTGKVSINLAAVDKDLQVWGDAASIDAGLETLIENAIAHGASEIELSTHWDSQTTKLFVKDNGSGITPGNRAKIFTPFFTTRRDTGGTGLGLSIARALLRQINAELDIVNEDGPTTFVIIFPSQID